MEQTKHKKISVKSAGSAKTLNPDQARSEYFPQMGRGAFYRALQRGQIPHVRLGRRIVIPRAALEKFMETCRVTPAGAA